MRSIEGFPSEADCIGEEGRGFGYILHGIVPNVSAAAEAVVGWLRCARRGLCWQARSLRRRSGTADNPGSVGEVLDEILSRDMMMSWGGKYDKGRRAKRAIVPNTSEAGVQGARDRRS